MKQWIIIGAGVTSLVAVIYTLTSDDADRGDKEKKVASTPDRGKDIDKLRREVARLQAEVLRSNSGRVVGQVVVAGGEGVQEIPVDDEISAGAAAGFVTAEHQEEYDARVAAKVAELNDHMMQEPVDVEWGNSVRTQLDNSLASASFSNTRVVDAQCHTTLCRLKLEHDERGEFEQAIDGFNDVEHTSLWVTGEAPVEGEPMRTTVFLSREEHAPPPSDGPTGP